MKLEKSLSNENNIKVFLILKKHQSRELNDYQKLIIDNFKLINEENKSIDLKIKFIDLFFDEMFNDIDKKNDFVFFDKDFAYNNIDLLKSCLNGIVLIENETVYFRKINKNNPINEELAINHNFKIAYLNPKEKENTNQDYKIIVDDKTYLYDLNKLKNLKK